MNINSITGVGPKTEKLLLKLGINDINDLISYYPYRYNIYSFSDNLISNDTITTMAIIEKSPTVSFIKKNFNRLSFRAVINDKIINVVIFNRAYLKQNLTIGKEITLIGKYDSVKNIFTASDIKFNIKDGDIEPIYHLTNGIKNSQLSKIINEALNRATSNDLIPNEYLNKYNFINKEKALRIIHSPKNYDEIKDAKRRLVYEELFDFSFKMNYLNKINKEYTTIPKVFDRNKIDIFMENLPFKLTANQIKAVNDILEDLKNPNKMNRLLLGDVGSGKTIVSTVAIYANFLAGFQSALMAPTEILALQHYFGINKILKEYGVITDVITGSMTKKEKSAIYKRLKEGKIDLLIGTHAILNDELEFNNLGFVITDEQHRFGVNQRSILQKKSECPDILYLSATPIPRTYAMTIYGDLDISLIKTKPKGRKEIITTIKKENEIKDVLYKILEEIKNNHQVYIVSPLVEQNDELDLNSVNLLKEKLDTAFNSKIPIQIIHGKMRQDEKDAIMNDFKNNKVKILIATTVIEVGIDVSNATMMVIFNAERFGLATLHQLRGRIGRNELQSYCYLISNYDNERLHVMEESNDGFYISEKDFELRGHGDLFGTRQSGDMIFKIADLKKDYIVLVDAKNDATEYIKTKKYLDNEYYKNISERLDIVD